MGVIGGGTISLSEQRPMAALQRLSYVLRRRPLPRWRSTKGAPFPRRRSATEKKTARWKVRVFPRGASVIANHSYWMS